jgi:hypothetical protein
MVNPYISSPLTQFYGDHFGAGERAVQAVSAESPVGGVSPA